MTKEDKIRLKMKSRLAKEKNNKFSKVEQARDGIIVGSSPVELFDFVGTN